MKNFTVAPVARNHHYLPQSYLAQFTETGAKDSCLFVHDVSNGKTFLTTPKNVAVERDFNRMEVAGEPQDIVERTLSTFEASAAVSIKNVLQTQAFPSKEEFTNIINLLCLFAVRNPKHRRKINASREVGVHEQLKFLVSDIRIFESAFEGPKKAGYLQKHDVSYPDMKSFIEEQRYSIEYTSEGNVRIEMDVFDNLLPVLGRRLWSINIAPPNGPTFVCSDDPVILAFKEGTDLAPGMPMGFGMPLTEVFLPLSPRIGFYGVYENAGPTVMVLTPEEIAKKNAYVVSSADRHIFSPKKEFMIFRKGKIQSFNLDVEFQRRQKRV